MTRFFMTVAKACQLVIQAVAIGHSGETLVLDMRKPASFADVARRVAMEADDPIDIVFTGLRPGEKLHESLLGMGEIDVAAVPSAYLAHRYELGTGRGVTSADPSLPPERLVSELRELVTEVDLGTPDDDGTCRATESQHAELGLIDDLYRGGKLLALTHLATATSRAGSRSSRMCSTPAMGSRWPKFVAAQPHAVLAVCPPRNVREQRPTLTTPSSCLAASV